MDVNPLAEFARLSDPAIYLLMAGWVLVCLAMSVAGQKAAETRRLRQKLAAVTAPDQSSHPSPGREGRERVTPDLPPVFVNPEETGKKTDSIDIDEVALEPEAISVGSLEEVSASSDHPAFPVFAWGFRPRIRGICTPIPVPAAPPLPERQTPGRVLLSWRWVRREFSVAFLEGRILTQLTQLDGQGLPLERVWALGLSVRSIRVLSRWIWPLGRRSSPRRTLPGVFLGQARFGSRIASRYRVEGEFATYVVDVARGESFWLAGDPESDPRVEAFLAERKGIPHLQQVA